MLLRKKHVFPTGCAIPPGLYLFTDVRKQSTITARCQRDWNPRGRFIRQRRRSLSATSQVAIPPMIKKGIRREGERSGAEFGGRRDQRASREKSDACSIRARSQTDSVRVKGKPVCEGTVPPEGSTAIAIDSDRDRSLPRVAGRRLT